MNQSAKRALRVDLHPGLDRAGVRTLTDDVVQKLVAESVTEVVVDVSRVNSPDVAYIDALARLQLAALRHGTSIRVVGPCADLVGLIGLVGLAELIPIDDSGVEPHR